MDYCNALEARQPSRRAHCRLRGAVPDPVGDPRVPRQRRVPGVSAAAIHDVRPAERVLGSVRAVRQRLVSRHRAQRLRCGDRHRGRPRQHRVLPGVPAADAIRRTGVRPRTGRLLSRRHPRRLGLVRAGGDRAVLPGAARPAAPPGRARRAPDDDLSVRLLFRRRLQREHVSAVHGLVVLLVPDTPVGACRHVRGGRDRHARERHHDVAGARVDRVAGRRTDRTRSPVGSGRTRPRGVRIRVVLPLHLRSDRQSVPVGHRAQPVGLSSRRRAVDGAAAP